jgi:ribosomal protein S18 acetylase RimI-like enzyme
MRDIPFFETQYGVASLVLKEIPYQQAAYITILDAWEPEELLAECMRFCRMCGAEYIYATGHPCLEGRALYTAMWELRRSAQGVADTDAALWPVQEQTLEQWRNIYNEKVRRLPNAAWMSQRDSKEMLVKGDGYFIHRGEELLGIGRASGDTIDWVAAIKPGAGRDVVCALAHALWCDTIRLTVASVNEKALVLYQSLGFVKTKEISRWFAL